MANSDLTAPGILHADLLVASGATTYTNTADMWDRYLRTFGLINGTVLDRMLIHANNRGITLQELIAGNLAATTSLYSEIMADGPVNYWRNGEASGGIMIDEVAADGSYVGSPTLGVAAIYPGSGADTAVTGFSSVIHGTSSVFPASLTSMTLVTVVRMNNNTGVQPLGIQRDDNGGGRKFQHRSNGTAVEFVRIVGTPGTYTAPGVLSTSTHILHTTVDTAGEVLIYKNGALQSGSWTGDIARAANYGGAGDQFQLGYSTGMLASLNGTTCENAVYDKVLSPARIAAHATASAIT